MAEHLVHFGPARLRLLPGRALFWDRANALVVADTHFGKSEVFRRQGLAVPDGDTEQDLSRLDSMLASTRASQLLILGDLVHGPVDDGLARTLSARFERWAGLGVGVGIVAGNHDRSLGDPARLAPATVTSALELHGLRCVHAAVEDVGQWTLCGHLHPVVRLAGPARDRMRMPVFWRTGRRLVLPAFGGFTGGHRVEPGNADSVWLAGPDAVVPMPR